MQPDSPLPPHSTPPTEPSILEEMAALTGLLNPEIIWKEEELLDDLDGPETQDPAKSAALTEPTTDHP
jgi:hypothetical protein